MTGTIKRLVTARAFGFITAADRTEYFFHAADVARDGTGDHFTAFAALSQDDAVEFDPVVPQPERGKRACHVRRVTATEPITGGIHV